MALTNFTIDNPKRIRPSVFAGFVDRVDLLKAVVHAHQRRSSSGTLSTVRQYEDKRQFKEKDRKRVADIVEKSRDRNGHINTAHVEALTRRMAHAITDADKAQRRGRAFEDENWHDMAKIFFDRAAELRGSAKKEEPKAEAKKEEPAKPEAKKKTFEVGVEVHTNVGNGKIVKFIHDPDRGTLAVVKLNRGMQVSRPLMALHTMDKIRAEERARNLA